MDLRNGGTLTANFAIDLVTALWLGFVGACIGSFLNVVAYRMPRGMSIVWKPSHCPKCDHPIRARDNVPVLGWLLLRGKCRDCGQPISPRYAIVEAVMGAAFFVLAYVELFTAGANLPGGPISAFIGAADIVWNPQWPVIGIYAYHCLLLSLLTGVVLMDSDNKSVPRQMTLFGLLVGITAVSLHEKFHPDLFSLFEEFGAHYPGVRDAIWGTLAGLLAGSGLILILCRKLPTSSINNQLPKLTETHGNRPENLIAGFAMSGMFLGFHAVWSIAVFTAVGIVILKAFTRGKSNAVTTFALWIAVLLLISSWKQTVAIVPW